MSLGFPFLTLIPEFFIVVASSSIPGLLGPTTLISKNDSGELEPYRIFGECWADGSFTNDIPRKQLSEFFNVNYFIVSQTNPHIVPFIYYNRGSSGEPSPHIIGSRLRGGFINSTLESLLKLEMKKWLRLLSDLDLLPSLGGTDLRWIFLQNFTGNVTIHPKLDRTLLWAYAHIASDPSAQNFERYLLEGQRWTWPKLCMINNHLGFERTLHQARQSLSL